MSEEPPLKKEKMWEEQATIPQNSNNLPLFQGFYGLQHPSGVVLSGTTSHATGSIQQEDNKWRIDEEPIGGRGIHST
ncbi:hypothetical protein L1987_33156 [Smallanthus sonchifolius]|uniref:Uncharacterized protein n=1 Tax=Smallanthus sonchifolius TaxID=185202 RepID=A0ACB9HSV4_9ASTR|nr:hypothetical protein L1987_33156 [Smallanthus sonchifolius]